MNGYVRVLTGVALVCAALSTLSRAYPEFLSQAGLDVWKLPELLQEEQAAARLGSEMEDRKAETRAYFLGRARILDRVADGSMSLFEGASAYREMNRAFDKEDDLGSIREEHPQATDEEYLCRLVIVSTGSHLQVKCDPQHTAAVVARLEAELEEQLRAGKSIVLPPVKSL